MAIFIRLYLSLSASEEFVIVKMNPRLAKKLRPAGTLVNSVITIRKKGEVAAGLCRFAIKETSHFKNKRSKLQTSPSGSVGQLVKWSIG